jgi:N-acetylneuraminate lyase
MVTATANDVAVLSAALATPYDREGAVDTEKLGLMVENYISRGVEGMYCCGSSGEGLLLSTDERVEVVRSVAEAARGRVPVIAHVGALSTREATELATRSQEAGASAISMVPPIYYHFGPAAILEHYRAVMDAVSVPMILYNIPQFTGTEFDLDSASDLLADDRVIGMKHTAHNMFHLERMREAFPDKAYIGGFDEVFTAAVAAGARGAIGTTIGLQVELFIAAREFLRRGDLQSAQRVQGRINETITDLVEIDVFPAAKQLSGLPFGGLGDCRRPFLPLSPEQVARIDQLSESVAHNINLTQQELSREA